MTSNTVDFFLNGDCSDPFYRNIRDLNQPHHIEARQFISRLWDKYHALADSHFREDAKNHFQERFWEMYLAVSLIEQGLTLFPAGGEGPEFYFEYSGKRIWVEAITPGSGEGDDYVPTPELGVGYIVPSEKILLRFTHALVEKQKKYLEAVDKKIISKNDAYLLAINSRKIPHAPFPATIPFFIQAFLPFGPLTLGIDPKTNKAIESYYQYREHVEKQNGANVSTTAFFDPEFAFCSAVLHSSVDCVNHSSELGDDFCVLHNPSAAHQIDQIILSSVRQFTFQNNSLIES